jgi:cell division protein FtsW (lipid II flippase)
VLLLLVAAGPGVSVNGARRWINLGVSRFQVVEAVKVIYIVWLASYLVRFRDEVNATWPAMLKPLGVAVLLVGLLLVQPDFGSATLLLAITAGMLVLGGVNLPRMFGCRWCWACRCWWRWPSSSRTGCAASPRSWIRGPTSSAPATSSAMR